MAKQAKMNSIKLKTMIKPPTKVSNSSVYVCKAMKYRPPMMEGKISKIKTDVVPLCSSLFPLEPMKILKNWISCRMTRMITSAVKSLAGNVNAYTL